MLESICAPTKKAGLDDVAFVFWVSVGGAAPKTPRISLGSAVPWSPRVSYRGGGGGDRSGGGGSGGGLHLFG